MNKVNFLFQVTIQMEKSLDYALMMVSILPLKERKTRFLFRKLENILNIHTFSHENLLLINGNIPKFTQETQNIERQLPMSLDDMAQQNTGLLNKIDQSFIKNHGFY